MIDFKKIQAAFNSSPRILVFGDAMLDRYFVGETQRISPEAPVPVVNITQKRQVLGGAGNVAANLSKLGAKVSLFTLLGQDDTGEELKRLAGTQDIQFFYHLSARPTISKTRILSSAQQMIRLDEENPYWLSPQEEKLILEQLASIINDPWDAWVLSDYGKGTCTEAICQYFIAKSRQKNIPIIIDPKGRDWQRYRGAGLVTPNFRELAEVFGGHSSNDNDSVESMGRAVQEKFSIENLLVTRSEKGMSLLAPTFVKHLGTSAQEVYDVSGAGDTVVAALALSLAAHLDLETAMEVANHAGGLVVAHVGTYALSQKELLGCLQAASSDLTQKSTFNFPSVLSRAQLGEWKKKCRQQGLKIVFTNGCFDILHRGHLDYLQRAKQLGDLLIVGLNSDASVKRLKGQLRPINSEEDRALLLSSLKFVDHVVIFEEDTPLQLLKEFQPDILVKGGDYAIENIVGREYAGQTLTLPFVEGHSSSETIKKIQKTALARDAMPVPEGK